MVDNFPGQPPVPVPTSKYPVTQFPQQAVVAGTVAVTDGGVSAETLTYLMITQGAVLNDILTQMKIMNYYLQAMALVQDEPDDLINELQRGN